MGNIAYVTRWKVPINVREIFKKFHSHDIIYFPSSLRNILFLKIICSAMAVCTSTLAGRLGAVVSNLVLGFLLDKSCEIPIIVIVIVLMGKSSYGIKISFLKYL